jgi:hypothetical protein
VFPAYWVTEGVAESTPPILKFPAPVKLTRHPVVPPVKSPEIVTFPVETVSTSFLPEVVAFIAIDTAVREPAPTLRVHVEPEDGRGIVTAPVTFRELVPLIVNVVFAFTAANVNEAQVNIPSTVMAEPLDMVIMSTGPTPWDL